MEQPALYVKASRVVEAELVRIETAERKRALRRANKKGAR